MAGALLSVPPASLWRHVLDLLPSGLIVIDAHGIVAEANPVAVALLGRPLIGERWLAVIGRAFRPRADDGHEVSLHDGRRWVHDPLRLTVVIDAPAASIDRIVQRHAIVRHLLDNGWLHLWRFEGEGFERRVAGGGWRALASDGA